MTPTSTLFLAFISALQCVCYSLAFADNDRFTDWTNDSFIQNSRKSLKRFRKWQKAHLPEVTLVKCLSKYAVSKIPDDAESFDLEIDAGEYDDKFNLDFQSQESKRDAGMFYVYSGPTPFALQSSNVTYSILNSSEEPSSSFLSTNQETRHLTNPKSLMWQAASLMWNAVTSILIYLRNNVYKPFIEPIWSNKLVSCPAEYAIDKFWEWVDAAPE